MENKRFHLELIQGVITRMAQNSFSLKGWAVTLVSALFALGAAGTERAFIYLAYLPSLAFWVLDAYFLRQERLFRELYDKTRHLNESQIDFSMSTAEFEAKCGTWWQTMTSRTLLVFYGALVGSILIVMIATILKT